MVRPDSSSAWIAAKNPAIRLEQNAQPEQPSEPNRRIGSRPACMNNIHRTAINARKHATQVLQQAAGFSLSRWPRFAPPLTLP
jgi:hypothetical protein